MTSADLPRLIYLVLLAAAVIGWFLAENRGNLGQSARMMLAWGLIFLGAIAAYGLWGDISRQILPSQAVMQDGREIQVPRGSDGHFHLTLQVNGVSTGFLVDTGASDVVLTRDDARRAGIDIGKLAFLGTASTANGTVRTAFVRLKTLNLGPWTFSDVPVAVNGGEMTDSLLGMSFLSRFNRLEIKGNTLTLEP